MPSGGCRFRAVKERKILFVGTVRVGSPPYFIEVWYINSKEGSVLNRKIRIVIIILKK